MSIDKINIPEKADNPNKKALLARLGVPQDESLSAQEINKLVGKTNELVEKTNELDQKFDAYKPVNAFNFKENKATYADLASIVDPQKDDAYGVLADGLIYIYNGEYWPTEGNGLDLKLRPTGQVAEGVQQAVSGGDVYVSTIKPNDLGLGKNKFTKDMITKGYYIYKITGEVIEGLEGAWAVIGLDVSTFSDKIAISGIEIPPDKAYSFEDSLGNILSFGTLNDGVTILTKPENAIKLNFAVKGSTQDESVLNYIQVEDGNVATGYESPSVQQIKDLPIFLNEDSKNKVLSEVLGLNILSKNSRLDESTVITSTTAGSFISLQSAVFSQGTNSLIVSPTTAIYSGLRHPGILLNIPINDYFILEFEARATTYNIPKIGIYPEIGTPVAYVDLTNTFKKFKFKLRREAVMFYDGRLSICTSTSNQNFPFEIKNISIYKEQVINRLVDAVFPNENELISIVGDSISTAQNNNAYELEILASDVGNEIQYYPTNLDFTKGLTIGGVSITNEMVGVLTSFTPNSSDVGKKLGEPANYNTLPAGSVWWEKVISHFKWELCQNVSWSGATTSTNRSTGTFRGSYSWHDRTIRTLKKRDVNGNWILPTKIIHYRGANDFSYEPYARIDNQYDVTNGYATNDIRNDGTIGYKEAISLFIKKCRQEYPFAEIILCTLNNFKRVTYDEFPTRNPYNTIIDYNNAIRECADLFGCRVIEFDKCGITFENMYPTYINDSATIPTHPNIEGHKMMANKAIKDLTV